MSVTIQNKLKRLALPRSEKQVAVAMAGHLWEKNPEKGTWVGAKVIGAECGLAERTVRLALAGLRQKKIILCIGHNKGRKANMPIYVFRPENGLVLPLFGSQEPATIAYSKAQEPAKIAEEPANQVKNLQTTTQEPATIAPDKDLRKLNEKERERTTADPPSYFVWLLSKYDGLNLTGKEKGQIENLIRGCEYELSVLREATGRILDPLDVGNSFDRAGDKVATNLETQCQAVLKAREKARETEELVRKTLTAEQEKATKELEARMREAALTESLIEDELPNEAKHPEAEEQQC